ncbi:hypothetical protein [Streptomyces bullii]|uniref:Integral membrane protein n=1 Tax=Streptomyces bullii TaxID=349910 RepID=A0ABW0UQK9_9ACTN
MSDLGERDRPGTPNSPGAWDARSEEWAAGGTDERDRPALAAPRPTAATATPARTPAAGQDGDRAAPAASQTYERKPVSPRRGADPVKALMHHHRELCERAVDPLEIAAGLEAHGVTDRTAARFRHRDVFSLAEEMYARVSRDGDTPARPAPATASRPHAGWLLLTLLPGTLCAATVAALRLTDGRPRLVAAAVGTAAVTLALRVALRRGPLSRPDRSPSGASATWVYWLVGYALLGNGLLHAAVTGGPDGLPTGRAGGPWPVTLAPVLAVTLSCAPAAWTAHLFAVRARRRLATSRGLAEFAAAVRPLLFAMCALFLGALAALLTVCAAALDEPAAHAETLTLGALLFLARLLTAHGFTHAPAVVLTATATAQAAALAAVFAARLPGCAALAVPTETLVTAWGPGSLPALTCGAAALVLLVHAARKLPRASAHAEPERPS